jgi:hypothetical protein
VVRRDCFPGNFLLYEKYSAFREAFALRKLQSGSLHAQAEAAAMNWDRRFYQKWNQFLQYFTK